MDRLTATVTRLLGAATLQSFSYVYNNDGQKASVVEHDGSTVAFQYDSLHRLASEVRTGAAATAYKYVGNQCYRAEADLGLIWIGSRRCDPAVGRWTTEDTWLGTPERTQSVNRYVYCEGDGVNRVDPAGLGPMTDLILMGFGFLLIGTGIIVASGAWAVVAVGVRIVLVAGGVYVLYHDLEIGHSAAERIRDMAKTEPKSHGSLMGDPDRMMAEWSDAEKNRLDE